MRSFNRSFAVAGALLTMAAVSSADAAGNALHSIVTPMHASSAVVGDSTHDVTEPYARRRCETTKPFRCQSKRAESVTESHSPA